MRFRRVMRFKLATRFTHATHLIPVTRFSSQRIFSAQLILRGLGVLSSQHWGSEYSGDLKSDHLKSGNI